MQTILVTGGAGYVGSILLRRLLYGGYRVICLDSLKFGGESILEIITHPNLRFFKVDIRDGGEVARLFQQYKPWAVVHLAAIVGDPACRREPEVASQTNWEASTRILDEARRAGSERFVFASTCSNYGRMSDPDSFVHEDSPLAPVSLYADLKVKFEKLLLQEINKTPDFAPTSLRFSTVYGLSPRMRFDLTVNEFTKVLTLGNELLVFGEQFWRPYCHVVDFSKAIMSVLRAPKQKVAYDCFNVGSTEENYTKAMIVNEIKKIIPEAVIKKVDKQDDPRDYRVDFSKIKKVLGFNVSRTVPDGIKEIKRIVEVGIISNPEEQRYYNIPHQA